MESSVGILVDGSIIAARRAATIATLAAAGPSDIAIAGARLQRTGRDGISFELSLSKILDVFADRTDGCLCVAFGHPVQRDADSLEISPCPMTIGSGFFFRCKHIGPADCVTRRFRSWAERSANELDPSGDTGQPLR